MTATERRRVGHPLPPARWPTAEEASRSLWFSPIRLGTALVAEQRTWVPAMVPWRATADGFVTPEVLDPGDLTLSLASDGRRRLSAPRWDPVRWGA